MPRTVEIPFPLSTAPGTHLQESAGRIINGYVEPLGDTAPSRVIRRRAPGLLNFGTSARSGFRGAVEINGTLYAAFNGQLERWTALGGASVNVGTLTGTKKGFFARNNKSPTPDQVFVDPDGNYASFTTAAVTNTGPVGIPAFNSVTSIDGYVIGTVGDGRAFASGLNDASTATGWNALSFGTAEAKPDGLVRAVAYGGVLFLFGAFTTEVWTNQGTIPFPFARSTIIPRGIAGPYCVAGFEDNFSRALIWVGDDNAVYRLNGYTPDKISPPDLDGLIQAVADKTQLEMSVYMSRGHAFILLSSLTWSWVFDLNTDKWAERNSYNLLRSRITGGIGAFGKWLCGDTLTGNIQEITSLSHQEVGSPFRLRLESGPVSKWPVGERVGRADFNFVTGVGMVLHEQQPVNVIIASGDGAHGNAVALFLPSTAGFKTGDTVRVSGVVGTTEANGTWVIFVGVGYISLLGTFFTHVYVSGGTVINITAIDPIETDPVVEISFSDDGGMTYFAPFIRKLGRQSETKVLVSLVANTGRSSWHGRRYRIDVSDPVYVGFMGGSQSDSPLARVQP